MSSLVSSEPINNYRFPESDENRPWGYWRTLRLGYLTCGARTYAYCDKEIGLKPGAHISLQRHFYREELWHLLDGQGKLYSGKNPHNLQYQCFEPNQDIYIPTETWHFLENESPRPLVFQERQIGILLDEKDIERMGDARGYDTKALHHHRDLVQRMGLDRDWPPLQRLVPEGCPLYSL